MRLLALTVLLLLTGIASCAPAPFPKTDRLSRMQDLTGVWKYTNPDTDSRYVIYLFPRQVCVLRIYKEGSDELTYTTEVGKWSVRHNVFGENGNATVPYVVLNTQAFGQEECRFLSYWFVPLAEMERVSNIRMIPLRLK